MASDSGLGSMLLPLCFFLYVMSKAERTAIGQRYSSPGVGKAHRDNPTEHAHSKPLLCCVYRIPLAKAGDMAEPIVKAQEGTNHPP